jgi:hypothetical protein
VPVPRKLEHSKKETFSKHAGASFRDGGAALLLAGSIRRRAGWREGTTCTCTLFACTHLSRSLPWTPWRCTLPPTLIYLLHAPAPRRFVSHRTPGASISALVLPRRRRRRPRCTLRIGNRVMPPGCTALRLHLLLPPPPPSRVAQCGLGHLAGLIGRRPMAECPPRLNLPCHQPQSIYRYRSYLTITCSHSSIPSAAGTLLHERKMR